jgi:hypothetical protein
MRGTLHLVAAEDAGWLVALYGPPFKRRQKRRLAELGLDEASAEKGVAVIRELLDRGPATRPEVRTALARQGVPAEGQATIHLLGRAAMSGYACYGPERDGKETFVALAEWLGPTEARQVDDAPVELARRYFAAFGPAAPEDFVSWSGLPAGLARTTFDRIGGELAAMKLGGRTLWLPKSRRDWLDEPPDLNGLVRLLPGYDNSLLGYKERDWLVPEKVARRIHPGGGIIRPVVLANGVAAGTWRLIKKGGGVEVDVEPAGLLPGDLVRGLAEEINDIGRFLGRPAWPAGQKNGSAAMSTPR